MTRFILHIGPHKTGSTYLQNHLTHNRAALADQGVYYPGAWTTPEIGWCHAELPRLLQRGQFELVGQTFAELITAGWPTILLSSEDFSSLSEDRLRYLGECTGPDTEIIFFARRWGELLPSCNQEHIRQGGTQSLPEFVARMLTHPFGADTMNFSRVLDRFAQAFVGSRLRVFSFNNVLKRGDNLFTYFAAKALGIDSLPIISPAPLHSSLSIEDIELVRALNVLRVWHPGEVLRRPNTVLPAILKAPLPCTRKAIANSIAELPFDEFAKPFKTLYDDIVAKYRAVIETEGEGADQLLFERQRNRLRYVDANYLMDPAVVPELANFVAELTGDQQRIARSPAPRQNATPSGAISIEFSRGGNSGSYCSTGWSVPEQNWQWAIGPEAQLLMPAPERSDDLLLTLKLRPFLARPRLWRQRMTIEINTVSVAAFEAADTEPTTRSCIIPSEIIGEDRRLVIVLRTPDAARPSDFDLADTRKLSFAFHTVTLASVGQNCSLERSGTAEPDHSPALSQRIAS
jgi:hypothetical protein